MKKRSKNNRKVKNPRWKEKGSQIAIPGKFPSDADFEKINFSWNEIPSDTGDFHRSCHRKSSGRRDCTSAFFWLYSEMVDQGYFDGKTVKFPSIYPGFEIGKDHIYGRIVGKEKFYKMPREFGNQVDFLRDIETYKYLGAANTECDVFLRIGDDPKREILRCDDWDWSCNSNNWKPMPYSRQETEIDCGFGNWTNFESKYKENMADLYAGCKMYPDLYKNDLRCKSSICDLDENSSKQIICNGFGPQPNYPMLIAKWVGGITIVFFGLAALCMLIISKFTR